MLASRSSLLFLAAFLPAATAATIESVWNGGGGGWSEAGKWTPARVPNNGGGDIFNVFIDGGKAISSGVGVDTNVTVNNLSLSAGDRLGTFFLPNLPDQSLTVNGNLTANSATLSLFSSFGVNRPVTVRGSLTAQSSTIGLDESAILDVNVLNASNSTLTIGQSIGDPTLRVGGGSVITNSDISIGRYIGVGGYLTIRDGDLTLNGDTTVSFFGTDISGEGVNPRLILEEGVRLSGSASSIGKGLAILNRGTITTEREFGFSFDATSRLTNEGTLQVVGDSSLGISAASLTNYDAATGTLSGGFYRVEGQGGTGTFAFDAPIIINAADIEVTGEFADFRALDSLADNRGSLAISVGRKQFTSGNLTNSGIIDIGCCGDASQVAPTILAVSGGTYTQTAGSTNVDGRLAGPGDFFSQQKVTVNLDGGILTGDGVILGDVFNNALVNPGGVLETGTLSVLGEITFGGPQTTFADYHQGATGALTMELGFGSYDRLMVDGQAFLDGVLNIVLIPGFRPRNGDIFELLHYDSLVGEFAQINGLIFGQDSFFTAIYGPTSFYLTTTTPEPSAFFLITAAFVLGFVQWRRRRSLNSHKLSNI